MASHDDGGKIRCARCHGALLSNSAVLSSSAVSSKSEVDDESPDAYDVQSDQSDESVPGTEPIVASHRPPVELDDWQFDEDLQSIERVLSSVRSTGGFPSVADSTAYTVDAAHSSMPNAHMQTELQNQPVPSENRDVRRRRPKSNLLAWTLLSLGLMTFTCGGVLLGWSFVDGRGELWTLGMPLTLGGQALLLVGLLFQLEGLWQSNRETTTTLDELDEQLNDLKHQTTILSTHSDPAKSFYAHMAEGASPQLLLSDLKGQLDLLAVKISDMRR